MQKKKKKTNELFLSVHRHQVNTSTTRDRIFLEEKNSFELVFVLCWYKSVAAECCSSGLFNIFSVPTHVSICLIRLYIEDELLKTLEISYNFCLIYLYVHDCTNMRTRSNYRLEKKNKLIQSVNNNKLFRIYQFHVALDFNYEKYSIETQSIK
jgi:hypothetical protein